MTITLDTARGAAAATVVVEGLPTSVVREASRWEGTGQIDPRWLRLLAVAVPGGESTPMVGSYAVRRDRLEFHPRFPLDPGRDYVVSVDPASVTPCDRCLLRDTIALPTPGHAPSTRVAGLLPAADTLPENLLRIYVVFTAPMSREEGLPFVRLLDDRGRDIPAAFLPVGVEFWNEDRTRYTLFFDPGRVKRGILPNEEMGRALVRDRRYTVRVDSAWRDSRGQPLVAPYERRFTAGPADLAPIAIDRWRVQPPLAGGWDTLSVGFPEPLDHPLVLRALAVESAGTIVTGRSIVASGGREWRFVPDRRWSRGDHHVVVLDILEDLAGNRIGRAFEVDLTVADTVPRPARHYIPFVVR